MFKSQINLQSGVKAKSISGQMPEISKFFLKSQLQLAMFKIIIYTCKL